MYCFVGSVKVDSDMHFYLSGGTVAVHGEQMHLVLYARLTIRYSNTLLFIVALYAFLYPN